MVTPPTFVSDREYRSRREDIDYWWPHVGGLLTRHGLADGGHGPTAGLGGTYPTFLHGDVVVKLFGYVPAWRQSYAGERAAHALVATDLEIAAPRVVAEGRLCDDRDTPWPYLITTRMAGVAWEHAGLSGAEERSVAADLGSQIRRVHALNPSGMTVGEDWPALNVVAAAERSSLPSHLVAQVDDYLARLGTTDRVFAHSDVTDRHVFVENGRLSGVIDWGDAMVTDRHIEIIQVYRAVFGCDKALLRAFLDACGWPLDEDFPRQALGLALCRQAHGLAQHLSMDVFEPIAAKFPLEEIDTLDDLAAELFAV